MLCCNRRGSGEKRSSLQGWQPAAQRVEGREKSVCGGCSGASPHLGGDPWGCLPQGCGRRLPQHLPSRRHLLCSAATDGSVAFWDITSPIVDAADTLHRAEGEMQPLGGCSCRRLCSAS